MEGGERIRSRGRTARPASKKPHILELPRWFQRPLADLVAGYHELDFTEHGPGTLAWHLSQSFGEFVVLELGPTWFEKVVAQLGDPFEESSRLIRRLEDALRDAYSPGTTWLRSHVDGDFLSRLFVNALGIRFIDPPPIEAPLMARPRLEKAILKVFDAVRGTIAPPQDVALMFIGGLEEAAQRMRLDAIVQRIALLHRDQPPLAHIVANRLRAFRLARRACRQAPLEHRAKASCPPRGRYRLAGEGDDQVWVAGREDCTRALRAFAEIVGLELVDLPAHAVLISAQDARSYDPRQRFARGDTLAHASFGVGVVLSVSSTAIEVAFPKGKRKLVHGRGS